MDTAKQGQDLLHGIPSNNITQIPEELWEWGFAAERTEQINQQMYSTLSIRLKNKNFMANYFFNVLIIITFNLPPGFRALGFQFYCISSEIYFNRNRTADFVIFVSVL